MAKRIYLDHASLTLIDRRVMREMKLYSGAEYANPSSIYKEGVAAKKALADGRKRVGDFIHAHADEIVFTSGGTEANTLALEGASRAAHRAGIGKPHLIVSAIEHSSIMETAAMLEKHGVEVTRLAVSADGVVDVDELRKAIRPETFMVSVMTVNNEIGSIQPIREIAKAVRWARTHVTKTQYPLFHTDAAQAALYQDLNVEQLGVDLLTLDGGKVCGPRGVGALYVRRDTPIQPIMYGGGQEGGLRSGTENLPAVMGLAKALDIAGAEREKEVVRVRQLREHFLTGLVKVWPELQMNGCVLKGAEGSGGPVSPVFKSDQNISHFSTVTETDKTAPHILNVSIPGVDNEFFVLRLDARGVAVSTKSSCLRDSDESYVIQAISPDLAVGRERSKTAIRFSFGRQTTKRDLDKALKIIADLAKPRAF